MASSSKIEALAWWLGQSRDNRTSTAVSQNLGVPFETAKKWVTAFNADLAKVASEAVAVHLREYREEYEVLQARTMRALPKLLDCLEINTAVLEDMAKNGALADPDLIGKTVTSLKAVYSLAEAASGADIAKKRAVQKSDDSNGRLALPDMGALFDSARPVDSSAASNLATEVITVESESILEISNENLPGSATSEEK